MTIKNIIKKSLEDFKSPQFLGLSLLPFLIIFMLFGYGYFHFGGDFLSQIQSSFDQGKVPFLDASAHPWITSVLTFSIFKWLFTILFYLFGIVAIVLFSVVIASILIGFFTPMIVKKIQKKHYPNFKFTNENFTLMASLPYYFKIFVSFVILGLIALPFMFIPAVNFIAIGLPFYYLFHSFMLLDVGSSIVSKQEYKVLTKKYKKLFRSTTLTLYGLSLVPVLGVFLQVFYVIVLAHEFFQNAILERN